MVSFPSIGARLRQARLAVGFSLDELASKLDRPLTKQALSKYETNKAVPTTLTLMDLARALSVKPSFLLSEPRISISWVGYRKHAALRSRQTEAITAWATKCLESEIGIRELFDVSPHHTLPREIPVNDDGSAEEAAEHIRDSWHLGELPINGVIDTIEEHGGIVLACEQVREFDGLSGWTDQASPVVVINSATTTDRRRFDAAHELGHLVMSVQTDEHQYEPLAHRFAAAFLVPRSVALRELGTKRTTLSFAELGVLKQRWGLSMQGWVRRAYDLAVIDFPHYRALNIEFRRRGWHLREPYQYEGREEPLLLRRLLSRALIEGILSSRDAADICPNYQDLLEPLEEPSHFSLRQLARLPRDQRYRILRDVHIEVDLQELDALDRATCDESDTDLDKFP